VKNRFLLDFSRIFPRSTLEAYDAEMAVFEIPRGHIKLVWPQLSFFPF
jgi:hypothetical protein